MRGDKKKWKQVGHCRCPKRDDRGLEEVVVGDVERKGWGEA